MKGKIPINETPCKVTNVYRTENYIVFQSVHVCYGDSGNILMSDDVYRLRTPERDAEYEKTFGKETCTNKARRMRVACYTRIYED